MFDIRATVRWVAGVIKDPRATAEAYRNAAPGWQRSFAQLALPVYLTAYLAAAFVALVTGGSFLFGSSGVGIAVVASVWALAWTFVIAFIFDVLSGAFGGKRRFDAAYAVVALAIVPAAAGTAISPLPWFGWLLSLAAGIYSLVLAYRFLPVFLEIPERAPGQALRALHRRCAAADRYDPPADGRLTRVQIERYADVQHKTRTLRERLGRSMRFEEQKPSFGDLMSGIGSVLRASTAEIEVVKSAGSNWAEHRWVHEQIENARIQQDLNPTTAHNYRLFLEHRNANEQHQ